MSLHYHILIIVFVMAIMIPAAYATYTVDPALITTVQNYIDSSKTQVSQEKWTRALAGLGGVSHDNPMTAQEAQINAYKFDPNRWNPVIEAMISLQGVTVDKPAALISAVQDYAAEAHVGSQHVDRWNRVLAALGSGTHDNPMTAAEAQTYADRGWKRWIPVVDTLTVLELQPQAAPQTEQAGQPPQWEQPQNPQDSPQNAEQAPTRQERIAEAKQIIQEMKSIAAELRQDLDEATAYVNTLDNKAPYTTPLGIAKVDLSSVESKVRIVEGYLSHIMTQNNYESWFQDIVFNNKLVLTAFVPAINEQLAPILVLSEWEPKMQVMREISVQAHAMVAEAKEFVKKWDETPTSYANAIERAERLLLALDISTVDKTYERLKSNPTSSTWQHILQNYESSYPRNFAGLEETLETLLSTARQPTQQEQCNQSNVECEWSNDSNPSRTQFTITDDDGIKTVISYWPSGEIQQYTAYYPNSAQMSVQINYFNPDVCTGTNGNPNWDRCRAYVDVEKSWYPNGQLGAENHYYSPLATTNVDRNAPHPNIYTLQDSDGIWVYSISGTNPTDGKINRGTFYYPDGSPKWNISSNGNTVKCFPVGENLSHAGETCDASHDVKRYIQDIFPQFKGYY